jgi:hypothetical protein
MKDIDEVTYNLCNKFREGIGYRDHSIRGAAVVSIHPAEDQRLVIYEYGGITDGDVPNEDFRGEVDVVRANLSKCGVKEILTLIVDGFGYVVVVEPRERVDTEKPDHSEICEFTEQGRTDFHILLKRLNDLAWQAWAVVHKVSLPGPQRLISDVKTS